MNNILLPFLMGLPFGALWTLLVMSLRIRRTWKWIWLIAGYLGFSIAVGLMFGMLGGR